MHWSLKQSILQSHKGTVIKCVTTLKFNISTRKCKTAFEGGHGGRLVISGQVAFNKPVSIAQDYKRYSVKIH